MCQQDGGRVGRLAGSTMPVRHLMNPALAHAIMDSVQLQGVDPAYTTQGHVNSGMIIQLRTADVVGYLAVANTFCFATLLVKSSFRQRGKRRVR